MSSDAGANAELGIAIQDAIAADARMKGKDGLAAQQAWSVTYLNERMVGMVIALMAIATPMILRQAGAEIGAMWIAGLLFLAVCVVAIRSGRRKNIKAIRERQLKDHRAGIARNTEMKNAHRATGI